MLQHGWALWSGVLGATASCVAKLAVSTDEQNPLENWLAPQCYSWLQSDLDELAAMKQGIQEALCLNEAGPKIEFTI